MTIGSLFSGIAGLELGLEMLGLGPVVWQVEKDPYAYSVLEHHYPEARRYRDVRSIDATIGRVDIVCGGFPCQDISTAGKGAGIAGKRSGLWREYARLVRELRPRFVLVENVGALRSRGLDVVLGDLAACGSMRSGVCFERSTSERRTSGKGSLFWPTPTAASYGSSQNGSNSDRPSAGSPSLENMARALWPTPTAKDGNSSGGRRAPGSKAHTGTSLTDAAIGTSSRRDPLALPSGPVLNPQFVEALMGFTPGWTDSAAWAMPLFPR